MSTVTTADLYPPKKHWLVRKYESRMRGTQGVDPAIVADELGLHIRTVCFIQRKLGLRPCAKPGRRAT